MSSLFSALARVVQRAGPLGTEDHSVNTNPEAQ